MIHRYIEHIYTESTCLFTLYIYITFLIYVYKTHDATEQIK